MPFQFQERESWGEEKSRKLLLSPLPHSTCGFLQQAVTGSNPLGKKISDQLKKNILQRYSSESWRALREEIKAKKWETPRSLPKSSLPVGNLSATTISSNDCPQPDDITEGAVFATSGGPHTLSKSTINDSGATTHLVNDLALLDGGTYHQRLTKISAGSQTFQSLGYGTKTIKSVLNNQSGKKAGDLILLEVEYCPGFHVNVVSEQRIKKGGLWYCGYDLTYRVGSPEKSQVVCQLETFHNLVFFEYKPLFTYLDSSREEAKRLITNWSNNDVILMAVNQLTLEPKQRSPRPRPSREVLPPREDSAKVWHLRTGHLGKEAMERLAKARGVKITPLTRLECPVCTLTHMSQQISRRPAEHKSPRPFWRISWDLQDYPPAYTDEKWLLSIYDEYTGLIYVYPLRFKTFNTIQLVLMKFERWVRRQYSLWICKIRQDNESGVLGIDGKGTSYSRWHKGLGIDIEPTPPPTHEPNGAIERMGQHITVMAIKMRQSANLPKNLWVEAVRAAAFLYNRSPRQKSNWASPIEVLETWFREQPRHQIRDHQAHHSPNWGGIYVYGCRAYLLKKEREAGQNKRNCKVEPRGIIGYLVGYEATNIYRI